MTHLVSTDHTILLVGYGNMGAALLRGWLAQGIEPELIRVVDSDPSALERARQFGVVASDAIAGSATDVVMLAVKPHQLAALLPDCRQLADAGALFVSIAAGKTVAFLEQHLGHRASVVRAMPNTPAAIGQGITALVANGAVSADLRRLAEQLMRAGGEVVWLEDETLMDAVTAVSGSGPAYVFLLIEALTLAAVEVGLDPALAERLARATVVGASAYAGQSALGADELRRQVTSPGGTTQAALDVLMAEPGLESLIRDAVRAATARSRDLA